MEQWHSERINYFWKIEVDDIFTANLDGIRALFNYLKAGPKIMRASMFLSIKLFTTDSGLDFSGQ